MCGGEKERHMWPLDNIGLAKKVHSMAFIISYGLNLDAINSNINIVSVKSVPLIDIQ